MMDSENKRIEGVLLWKLWNSNENDINMTTRYNDRWKEITSQYNHTQTDVHTNRRTHEGSSIYINWID